MSQVVGLPNNSYKPITNTAWIAPGFVNYKKECTRLAVASDKVYQLLGHGRWFSPGPLASSTTKTVCHDIDEILLKVALKHKKSINQSLQERTINNFQVFGTPPSTTATAMVQLKYFKWRNKHAQPKYQRAPRFTHCFWWGSCCSF